MAATQFLISLAFLLCIRTWASPSSMNKLDDGVLVVRDHQLRARVADWTLYVSINPPAPPAGFKEAIMKVQNKISSIEDISIYPSTVTTQWNLRLSSVRETVSHQREKRSLLGFVGKISNFLFGTATEDQIRETQDMISQAAASQKVVFHSIRHMSSVLNKTRGFVRENRAQINQLVEHVQATNINLAYLNKGLAMLRKTNALEKTRIVISSALATLQLIQENFEQQVKLFDEQRYALERGKLTEQILPPSVLEQVLDKASISVNMALENIEWYYQFLQITPFWGESELLVYKVVIPLVDNVKYIRYVIHSWPVPYNTSKLAIQLAIQEQVYGLNTEQGGMFLPTNCQGRSPSVCETGAVYSERELLCPRAIISRVDQIKHTCAMKIIRSDLVQLVYKLDGNQYVVISWGGDITTRCAGKPVTIQNFVPGAYMLTVPQNCSIHTAGWRIEAISHHLSSTEIKQSNIQVPIFNFTVLAPSDAIHNIMENFNMSKLGAVPEIRFQDLAKLQEQAMAQRETFSWSRHGGFMSWGTLPAILVLILVGMTYFGIRKNICAKFRRGARNFRRKDTPEPAGQQEEITQQIEMVPIMPDARLEFAQLRQGLQKGFTTEG